MALNLEVEPVAGHLVGFTELEAGLGLLGSSQPIVNLTIC